MNNKGLNTTTINLLIILFTLVSVGIIWVVIDDITKDYDTKCLETIAKSFCETKNLSFYEVDYYYKNLDSERAIICKEDLRTFQDNKYFKFLETELETCKE